MTRQRIRVHLVLSLLTFGVSLSGCTGTHGVLSPDEISTNATQQSAQPSGAFKDLLKSPTVTLDASTHSALALQQTANVLLLARQQHAERIVIASIQGAPSEQVKALKDRLQAQALNGHLIFVEANTPSSVAMRGFLSASIDNGQVKVSYIWDISGSTNANVMRLQGAQTASVSPGAKSNENPWQLVTPELMQSVADDTVDVLIRSLPTEPHAVASNFTGQQ